MIIFLNLYRSHQQIYLNSTRQTRIDILSATGNFYPSRTIFRISDISPNTEPPFGELDFAGLVVFVHSSGCGSSSLQTVYFTDNGDNFFGLVFWRGLRVIKKHFYKIKKYSKGLNKVVFVAHLIIVKWFLGVLL